MPVPSTVASEVLLPCTNAWACLTLSSLCRFLDAGRREGRRRLQDGTHWASTSPVAPSRGTAVYRSPLVTAPHLWQVKREEDQAPFSCCQACSGGPAEPSLTDGGAGLMDREAAQIGNPARESLALSLTPPSLCPGLPFNLARSCPVLGLCRSL